MKLRSIKKIKDLKGKRVLLRVDFNVPITRGKVDQDGEWRLKKAVPTVEALVRAKARVILVSHRGRPKGKKVRSLTLTPVAKRFSKMIGKKVRMLSDCVGSKVEKTVQKMKDGDIVMLENLRFYPGEEKNQKAFAVQLAALGDIYVNDAFATAHRTAASMVAITKELPSYAGPLVIKEVESLERLIKKPENPYVVIMGGAKVSTKIGAIGNMLTVADRVLLGGALIVPFFKAMGFGIGSSQCSDSDLRAARKLMRSKNFKKLILPIDVIIGNAKRPKDRLQVIDLAQKPFDLCIKKGCGIMDVGPKTVSAYASFIRSAKTLAWNGPLGLFEIPKFSHGTLSLGRLIAARSSKQAFGVVGGGETVMALEKTGLSDCVDHISTGGGALLEFLEGKELPGLKALKAR